MKGAGIARKRPLPLQPRSIVELEATCHSDTLWDHRRETAISAGFGNEKTEGEPYLLLAELNGHKRAIFHVVFAMSGKFVNFMRINPALAWTLLRMQDNELDNSAEYSELIDLVAQFDAGNITRTEFQQRVRALPNDRLLILSQILTAGPEGGRLAARTSGQGMID